MSCTISVRRLQPEHGQVADVQLDDLVTVFLPSGAPSPARAHGCHNRRMASLLRLGDGFKTELRCGRNEGKLEFNHTATTRPLLRTGERGLFRAIPVMKLHADRAEGVNVINACTVRCRVRQRRKLRAQHPGVACRAGSGLAGSLDSTSCRKPTLPTSWPPPPEVVIFGSGPRLRFPHPALLRSLMAARIGVEPWTRQPPAAPTTCWPAKGAA